ncbi:MAG: EVE domain-containing protein [Leptospirales bacterium]|nr:EVE domain-containing protein [Leptospirales bacterium]
MKYWILKSEPEEYSIQDLLRDGEVRWDGIRNYQARNFLRSMQLGDIAVFYHSGKERACVGEAEVVSQAYPDPADESWSAVQLRGLGLYASAVKLATLKALELFGDCLLVRHSRLSVSPLSAAQYRKLAQLAGSRVKSPGRR